MRGEPVAKDFPHLPQLGARDQCVLQYVYAAMQSVRELSSFEKLSDPVKELHEARHPEVGAIKWSRDQDTAARQKVNAQTLRRLIGFQRRASHWAALEESLVLALPAQFRDPCVAELTKRYGRLAIPIPDPSRFPDLAAIGRMAIEFGQTFERLSPISKDGCIDARDLPHIPAALREIDDLLTAVLAVQAQLLQIQREAQAEAAGI